MNSKPLKNSPTQPPRRATYERFDHHRKGAVVSTGHITQRDGELILDLSAPWLSHVFSDGAASVFNVPNYEQFRQAKTSWERHGFSESFVTIMEDMLSHGFEYVSFDRDGPHYSWFASYEW